MPRAYAEHERIPIHTNDEYPASGNNEAPVGIQYSSLNTVAATGAKNMRRALPESAVPLHEA